MLHDFVVEYGEIVYVLPIHATPTFATYGVTIPVEALRMVLTGVTPVVYTSLYHKVQSQDTFNLSEYMQLGRFLLSSYTQIQWSTHFLSSGGCAFVLILAPVHQETEKAKAKG